MPEKFRRESSLCGWRWGRAERADNKIGCDKADMALPILSRKEFKESVYITLNKTGVPLRGKMAQHAAAMAPASLLLCDPFVHFGLMTCHPLLCSRCAAEV